MLPAARRSWQATSPQRARCRSRSRSRRRIWRRRLHFLTPLPPHVGQVRRVPRGPSMIEPIP